MLKGRLLPRKLECFNGARISMRCRTTAAVFSLACVLHGFVLESYGQEVETTVWQWLDANIGSMERLVASKVGQQLSGADVGTKAELSSAQRVLFREQLNLLYAIRKSKDIAIAKQYMLVHTLMTLGQAQHALSLLENNDPRRAGVVQQMSTAKQLLDAIGYEMEHATSPTEP